MKKIYVMILALCMTWLCAGAALAQSAPQEAVQAAHDYARWESDIAAFEKTDQTTAPPKGAVLFVGSSTIVRWVTLAADFPNRVVLNRGFGGSEICDSTYYAARMIFPYQPSAIFLRAGSNDIAAGKSPAQVFADFQAFVATVRAKLPTTPIVFIGLAPTIARWDNAAKEKRLNQLVEAYTKTLAGLYYVDTYSMSLDADGQPRPELFVQDRLHFSPDGYELLAQRVRPFLP